MALQRTTELDEPSSKVPEWLTIHEAAFVAGVTEDDVLWMVDEGELRSSSLTRGRRDPELLLVLASDLEEARQAGPLLKIGSAEPRAKVSTREPDLPAVTGSDGSDWSSSGPPSRRPELRDWIRIVLGFVLLGAWFYAIRPMPLGDASRTKARPVTSVAPIIATEPEMSAPSPAVAAPSLAPMPQGLAVRWTGFLSGGDRVVAAARIANTRSNRWLTHGDVLFVAKAADGEILATALASTELGPGEAGTLVVDPLPVPDPTATIASLEVTVDAARFRPAASYRPGRLTLREAGVDRGSGSVRITGHLRNAGARKHRVLVNCVAFSPDGTFAGAETIVVTSVGRGSTGFGAPLSPAGPGASRAVCSLG